MTAANLAKLLLTLEEHAPGLRKAGVLTVSVGEVTAELAPHIDATPQPITPQRYTDPLSDPETYGATGRVPGFTRELDDL